MRSDRTNKKRREQSCGSHFTFTVKVRFLLYPYAWGIANGSLKGALTTRKSCREYLYEDDMAFRARKDF